MIEASAAARLLTFDDRAFISSSAGTSGGPLRRRPGAARAHHGHQPPGDHRRGSCYGYRDASRTRPFRPSSGSTTRRRAPTSATIPTPRGRLLARRDGPNRDGDGMLENARAALPLRHQTNQGNQERRRHPRRRCRPTSARSASPWRRRFTSAGRSWTAQRSGPARLRRGDHRLGHRVPDRRLRPLRTATRSTSPTSGWGTATRRPTR